MAQSQEEFDQLLAAQHKRLQRSESASWREFQKRRAEGREAIARGEQPEPPQLPSLSDIFKEKVTADLAERARLEAERIAAIPARDRVIAALPYGEQVRIQKYEQFRGPNSFPLETLGIHISSD